MATAIEVAAALGVTRQAVNKRARRGSITREADGSFDLQKVMAEWDVKVDRHQQRRSVERSAEDSSNDSLYEAQRTDAWLKVQQRQLDLQEQQGEMVKAEEVERVWSEIAVTIRNTMLVLAGKLAPRVAAISDVRECHVLLDREIREALRSLSTVTENHAAA